MYSLFTLKVYLPAVEESGQEVDNILESYFDKKIDDEPEIFPVDLLTV